MPDRLTLLALDTALAACSVAVWSDGQALAARSEPMTRGHQERLAAMAAEVMAEAGLAFADLDRLAVTVGPGSFTGLRVGLAFAKAMALALDIPCTGVGTLQALAASDPEVIAAPLAAVALDARAGRVYLQSFAHGAPLQAPSNLHADAAQAQLKAQAVGLQAPLIGDGAPLLREGASAGAAIDPVALARLAASWPTPDAMPAPVYLRAPDARTLAERAALAAQAACQTA